jgi:callose synthase
MSDDSVKFISWQMCSELCGLLHGYVNTTTGENAKPAYGGEEAFLKKVITPIYQVIAKVQFLISTLIFRLEAQPTYIV